MPRTPRAWPRQDGGGGASAPTSRSPSGPPSRVAARPQQARVRPPSRPPPWGRSTGRRRTEVSQAARATAPEAQGAARSVRSHCAGASHPGPRGHGRCSERAVAQSSAAQSSSPPRPPRSCAPALTTRSPGSAASQSDHGPTGASLPDPRRSDAQQPAPWLASATHGAPAYPLPNNPGILNPSLSPGPRMTSGVAAAYGKTTLGLRRASAVAAGGIEAARRVGWEEAAAWLLLRLGRGAARGRHVDAAGCGRLRLRRAGLLAAAALLGRGRPVVDLLGLGDHLGAAFAVGEPDVVNRVLDAVQAGARREHPARENAAVLVLEGDFIDLDEHGRVRALGLRAGVADARRQLQRPELHRLVDRDLERDDPPGDLVETGEHGRRVLDLVRLRLADDAGDERKRESGFPAP